MLPSIIVVPLLSLSWYAGMSQNQLYSYQQLSNLYYAPQKDSLKKAWVCPEVFNDRPVQKKFRELWDERTNFMVKNSLKEIHDSKYERYSRLKNIFRY